MSPQSEPPLLRVVRGDPSAQEIAALVAVLATASGPTAPPEPGPRSRSRWADRAALVRGVPRPGPGAWRASTLPG